MNMIYPGGAVPLSRLDYASRAADASHQNTYYTYRSSRAGFVLAEQS